MHIPTTLYDPSTVTQIQPLVQQHMNPKSGAPHLDREEVGCLDCHTEEGLDQLEARLRMRLNGDEAVFV